MLHPYTPDYMTISELDRRFGEILRRIEALEAEVGGTSTQERPERQPDDFTSDMA